MDGADIQCRRRSDRAQPRRRARRPRSPSSTIAANTAMPSWPSGSAGSPMLMRRLGIHPRTAHPALPARRDRFSDGVSRGDQGRDRAGRGQHPAEPRRIRLHAGRQPSARRRGVGSDTAGHAGGAGDAAGARCPNCSSPDADTGRAFAGRPARRYVGADRRDRADPSGRALLLALLLGLDRPAEGHGPSPFEPDADRRTVMRSRCSASAKSDVVFSAAKLFFAYGLGNALTFPMAVGATSVLTAERPSPASVARVLRRHRPTIFCGVPTLYNAMLADPDLPRPEELALRRCVSAGEPLPQEIGRRWSAADRRRHSRRHRLDRDAAHLSQQPARRSPLRHHRQAGPRLRAADRRRGRVSRSARGEIGDLLVSGPTSAAGYWNNRERSRATFIGEWTRTGDKYLRGRRRLLRLLRPQRRHDEGQRHVRLAGRGRGGADRARQCARSRGRRRAGRGRADQAEGVCRGETRHRCRCREFAGALEAHAKTLLAPFKCPRWIDFLDELPKTATGKIQRFKLRGEIAGQQ